MEKLSELKCVACHRDAIPVSRQQIRDWLVELPGWSVLENDGVQQLVRDFTFRNFADALKFTNLVGEIAETEDHHPRLVTEWGRVRLSWWTHKIGGLHRNDFVMAAKSEHLYLSIK